MTIENPYKSLLALLILTLITACHGASNEVTLDAPETLVGKDAVIYGNDDRQEVYQHDGDVFGQIARNATAVLVQSNSIYSSGGSVTLYGASLGQTMGLCSDERFYSQPTPGFCSGTLIAPDLILTAGHCISNSSCGSTRFAFDYYYTAPNQLQTISTNDVYSCSQVLVRKEGQLRRPNLRPRDCEARPSRHWPHTGYGADQRERSLEWAGRCCDGLSERDRED